MEKNKEDNKEDNKNIYKTIDEYILLAPVELQERLQKLRETIREAAPEAKEKISWKMATFDLHGNLVHFAFYKNHIGFYPGETGIHAFEERLSQYKSSKGAVQFPLNQPLPLELVREIVHFRVTENETYAREKLLKVKRSNRKGDR